MNEKVLFLYEIFRVLKKNIVFKGMIVKMKKVLFLCEEILVENEKVLFLF